MVTARRGRSSVGCLFTLLVLAAVAYFGVNVGEAYFRFYQFQDAMRQEVRFADHNDDAAILRHLRAQADSLGLPEAAGHVSIERDGRTIDVESEYSEHIELPLFARDVRFTPHASGTF
jgi:hypothetical protein